MKRINKFMNAEELDPSNVIRDSFESSTLFAFLIFKNNYDLKILFVFEAIQ